MNDIPNSLSMVTLQHEVRIFLPAIVYVAILPCIQRPSTDKQAIELTLHSSIIGVNLYWKTRSSPIARIELPHVMFAVLIGDVLLLHIAVLDILLLGNLHRVTVKDLVNLHYIHPGKSPLIERERHFPCLVVNLEGAIQEQLQLLQELAHRPMWQNLIHVRHVPHIRESLTDDKVRESRVFDGRKVVVIARARKHLLNHFNEERKPHDWRVIGRISPLIVIDRAIRTHRILNVTGSVVHPWRADISEVIAISHLLSIWPQIM